MALPYLPIGAAFGLSHWKNKKTSLLLIKNSI